MLGVGIFILILVGLVIHRYLTNFWEQGILPYATGFLTFANIFVVIYLVNFVWMFGLVVGIVIFALTIFQIIYASFLWPFLLPQLISIHKKPTIPKVNPYVFGSWTYLVIGLGLLAVVNFFITDYASLTESIVNSFGGSYIKPILWLVGVAVLSNIIRSYTLSKFLEKNTSHQK